MVNENIALVQDFVSAFNRFDLDAVEDMMAPDIFYHNIPFAPCIGRRAFRDFMTGFPAVSASWVIHAIAANGDTVLTERTDKFFMADKSTISVRVMGAFEIDKGKSRSGETTSIQRSQPTSSRPRCNLSCML